MMMQIELTDYLTQFQFPATDSTPLGRNIFVLHRHDDAILIDTGYEENIMELLPTLEQYRITHIIVTHYHLDHVSGLMEVIRTIPKVGSIHYHKNLLGLPEYLIQRLKPTILVDGDLTLSFHDISIHIKSMSGHSISDVLIEVNDTYLFIGDQLIFTNRQEQSIPYAEYSFTDHISVLKYIKEQYPYHTLLPSHGNAITNDATPYIDHAIQYLSYLQNGNHSLESFYKINPLPFQNDVWHKYNIKK